MKKKPNKYELDSVSVFAYMSSLLVVPKCIVEFSGTKTSQYSTIIQSSYHCHLSIA